MESSTFWWMILGLFFVMWIWSRLISLNVARLQIEIKKTASKIVFMKIENHNDIIFAYNAHNNEFVCQGKDMEDLNQRFTLRYPTCKGVIVDPSNPDFQ